MPRFLFTCSPRNLEWKVLYLEIKPNYFARTYSTMEKGNTIIDRSDMRKEVFSFAIKIGDCCKFILGWGLFYIIILINNLPVRTGELGVNLLVKSWISTSSIGWSSIGQVLGTKHSHSQPSVILVTGYQWYLFWPHAHQTHIWLTDMHAGKTFTVIK